MTCPTCDSQGSTSRVFRTVTSSPALPADVFEDGQGTHEHDPNPLTVSYNCSKKHKWTETAYKRCPACGVWQ